MTNSEVREGYLYTKDHEWVSNDSPRKIGITAYAVEQLGDITMVEIKVRVGDLIKVGDAFGVVESVKSVSDLFSPISGKVVAIHEELDAKPELVNEDPYGEAWMISVEPEETLPGLMDAEAYQAFLKTV